MTSFLGAEDVRGGLLEHSELSDLTDFEVRHADGGAEEKRSSGWQRASGRRRAWSAACSAPGPPHGQRPPARTLTQTDGPEPVELIGHTGDLYAQSPAIARKIRQCEDVDGLT